MHRRFLPILALSALALCADSARPATAGEIGLVADTRLPFITGLPGTSSGFAPGRIDRLASLIITPARLATATGSDEYSPLPPSPSGWDRAAECFVRFYITCPIGAPETSVSPPGRSVLTIFLLTGTLAAVSLGIDSPASPRWSSGNGFDDGIRSGLVAGSASARRGASTASDVLLGTLGAGLVADWAWKGRRDRYPVANSALTDTSWILGSLVTTQSVKLISARQRPYVENCQTDPRYVIWCDNTGDDNNKAFFSGHASLSGTLAGLICARHLAPTDRDGWDWTACGGAAGVGLAVGLLRIVADRHHATDILVGWTVGAAFGYALPRMFDYRSRDGMFSRISVRPVAGMREWGMTLSYAY